MTDPAAPAAPAEKPQPAPQVVDVAAITKAATEAATKAAMATAHKAANEIAAKKLSDIGRAFTGESTATPEQQFFDGFVKNPLGTMSALKDMTKRELKDEMKRVEDHKTLQRSIVNPFIADYPELNSPRKLAMVEKLADTYTANGMDYKAALAQASQDTVTEFNLTKVSEAERSNSYGHGLPGGGGVRAGAAKFNEEKSQGDFLSAMRARSNSFRKKV